MVSAHDVAALRAELLRLARQAQSGQGALYFALLKVDEGLARAQALLELNEDPRRREAYLELLDSIHREQEARRQERR